MARSAKQIINACEKLGTSGAKWKEAMQTLGLEVLAHVDLHGDTSVAVAWVNAVGQSGAKVQAAKAWLRKFGKLKGGAEDSIVFNKKGTTDLEGATATPWHSIASEKKADKVIEEMDAFKSADAALKRIMNQVKALQEQGKTVKGLDKLQAAMDALQGVTAE